jgi:hypothetical protein
LWWQQALGSIVRAKQSLQPEEVDRHLAELKKVYQPPPAPLDAAEAPTKRECPPCVLLRVAAV